MKRLFIILSIALLAIACNKEEENTEKNFISFGNEKTEVTMGACGYAEQTKIGGPGYAFHGYFTLNNQSCTAFLDFSAACKGKKIDLAKADSNTPYRFEINSPYEASYPYDIHQYNEQGEITHSTCGAWFKSGTLQVKDDGKTLSLDVNATLQDGRSFKMNITSESKTFE